MTNTKMSLSAAKTLQLTLRDALLQALDCDTAAATRCCLETALSAARHLAQGGRLQEADRAAVEAVSARLGGAQ